MQSLQSVRREANIHETPTNVGLELDVKIRAYDSGLVTLNGRPLNHRSNPGEGYLAVLSGVAEYVQELRRQAEKRNS